jgi:hypothetical protein
VSPDNDSDLTVTLRFGVLCAGTPQADLAQSAVIQKLAALGGVEFALLVVLEDVEPRHKPVGPVSKLGSTPQAPCSTTTDADGCRRLDSRHLETIAAKRLDLMIDFTGELLAGEILDIPVHGVWTLVHTIDRTGGISVAALIRLCNPPGTAIRLATCVLHAEMVSELENRRAAMLAAADLPANVCRDLLSGRTGCLSAPARPDLLAPRQPPAWQRIFSSCNFGLAWASRQISALLFMETWNVGIVDAPIHRFLEPGFRPAITWIPPIGPHKFIADPFAATIGNRVQLLAEEFDFDRYQGYISSAEWIPGRAPEWKLRIDEGLHMSYPFAFQYGGEWYVAPESSLNGEVALYRCDPASGRWQKLRTLIEDFAALDPTLIEYEGRWWLFCTRRGDFPDAKLYLWHAPELFGPWQPHCMNPVKCDIRSSRPGGTLFQHQGSLYRPAQDSSVSYGGALTINRIIKLTVEEFREEPAIHLEPSRDSAYPDGWHTLSAAGPITVLDGKRMAFIPGLSARRLQHKLGRLAGLLFRRKGIG